MDNSTRRNFFKWSMASIGAAAFFKSVGTFAKDACPQAAPTAAAIKSKLLDFSGKTAKRLDFVANSADAKGNKKFTAGASCGNCKFYKAAKEDATYGKCAMVANKFVPACGWCKSYKANAKSA